MVVIAACPFQEGKVFRGKDRLRIEDLEDGAKLIRQKGTGGHDFQEDPDPGRLPKGDPQADPRLELIQGITRQWQIIEALAQRGSHRYAQDGPAAIAHVQLGKWRCAAVPEVSVTIFSSLNRS